MFFIQKAKQIMEMIGNFLGSIGEIAAGNIGAAADALEKGLARGLTLVINFLARFLHLDGITAKIRAAIQKLRAKVDGMLDKVANWIVTKGKAVLARVSGKFGGKERTAAEKEADLRAAVEAVRKINPEKRSRVLLTPALYLIRRRYRLTELAIVREAGATITIHAAVNPEMMFDLPGKKEEPGDVRWIAEELQARSRTQFRLLHRGDTIERVRTILMATFPTIPKLPPRARLEVVADGDGRGHIYLHLDYDLPRRDMIGQIIPPEEAFTDIPNPDAQGIAETARHKRTKMIVVKDARKSYVGPKVISGPVSRRCQAHQGQAGHCAH